MFAPYTLQQASSQTLVSIYSSNSAMSGQQKPADQDILINVNSYGNDFLLQ
jgi:hypothetical protein